MPHFVSKIKTPARFTPFIGVRAGIFVPTEYIHINNLWIHFQRY